MEIDLADLLYTIQQQGTDEHVLKYLMHTCSFFFDAFEELENDVIEELDGYLDSIILIPDSCNDGISKLKWRLRQLQQQEEDDEREHSYEKRYPLSYHGLKQDDFI